MYNNKPQQEGRSLLLEVDKAPLVSVGLSLFPRADNLACNSWLLVDTSLTFLGTPPIIAGQQLHLFYLQGYDDQCCLRTQSSKFNSDHSLLCQHMDQAAHFQFRIFPSAGR